MSGSKKTYEAWKRVRARIEKGWTQGTFARDVYWRPAPPESCSAVCWCLEGAVLREGTSSVNGYVFAQARKAIRKLKTEWIAIHEFNDAAGRTKEHVLALCDHIIRAHEEKGYV